MNPLFDKNKLSRRHFLQLSAAAGAASMGLGYSQTSAPPVRVGYLPITDATPLLTAHARKDYAAYGLDAEEPVLFRGWSSLIEAFLAREVNVVHVLMPISIWLRYATEVPVKVVAWTHTNGSGLTVAPHVKKVQDLSGQTVAVPFWYSIHNIALQHLLRQNGLEAVLNRAPKEGQVELRVMPPPEMPVALANGALAGFIVADPFNALAENLGVGKILRYTGDVWHQHACCVTLLHEDDLYGHPDWAQAVISALVSSQQWVRNNRAETADLLTNYLPQPIEAIQRVLLDDGREDKIIHPDWEPNPWIDFQPYPFPSYTQRLIEFLKQTKVEGDTAFLGGLEPSAVHSDLIEDLHVLKAMNELGGFESFGLSGLERTELIEGV